MAVSKAPGLPLLPTLLVLTAAPLPGALATGEVWQSPAYAITPEGGSINITCSSRGPLIGVFLKQYRPKEDNVMYYGDESTLTVDPRFNGRIVISGSEWNLTITMHQLLPNDTGAYVCEATMKGEQVQGSGTLVVVTDAQSQAATTCQGAQLTHVAVSVALALGFLLILLVLGATCVLRRTQIKKLCWVRDKSPMCVVYEDMSCTRRNTISTPNDYQ
ncbi:PREDICTED: T-cell antigen CD7 [Miniopterus natalensis]|uniref:T-cell antigen CD7 n=1 Tax=Miniopterus natalensis TaxID=291302 RepID=UPI0007A718E7|nr:PREDICTED: T-cell antigen CD7 [Miniopterus natalensis]